MSTLPPPRYRIVERGRRLITIDTLTGQEIGLGASLANVDLAGARQTAAPPRNKTSSSLGAAPVTPVVASAASRSSALNPLQAVPAAPAGFSAGNVSPDKQGKIVGLIVFGFIAVIFLIATGLWFIPVLLMIVPQSRKAIVPVAKAAFSKYMGQAANG